MTQIRFGKLIVLACMGLAVACTSGTDDGTAGNTELNLDIVNPGGDPSGLGFSIDRVDYRITCATVPGLPIPDANTIGTGYIYDDSVDISGSFEVVDTRVPPVWQAVMDLPLSTCTVTLSVWDGDEVVCIGSQALLIDDDTKVKYDIVLVCSLSIDLPDGVADIDGNFFFITGNVCPKLYLLNAIPSGDCDPLTLQCGAQIPVQAGGPYIGQAVTEVQYRAKDPDGSCGNNCDPQTCDSTVNPPDCDPASYNPNDPFCNSANPGPPAGDPNSPFCTGTAGTCEGTPGGVGDGYPCNADADCAAVGGGTCTGAPFPNASGLVCTVIGFPVALQPDPTNPTIPGGQWISPRDLTTQLGPILPVNLNNASGIPGIVLPGLGGPVTTSSEPTGGGAGDNPLYPALPNATGLLPPLRYSCDINQPGPVIIVVQCSDGDEECDSSKSMIVNCPGENFCVSDPIDCSGSNECLTDGVCDANCDPADLPACVAGRCPGQDNPEPAGTPCTVGGNVCNGGGACVECLVDADCVNSPAPVIPGTCQLANTCVANACVAGGAAPGGTVCANGTCDGSGPPFGTGDPPCVFQACDPCEQDCGQNPNTCSGLVTLGCTNNITANVSILPWVLDANPDTILAGAPFNVAYGGAAVFDEAFLDAGLAAVPGLKIAEFISGVATVLARTGATGPSVPVTAGGSIPDTCGGGANVGLPCTRGNEAVDCPPGLPFVSCGQFVAIPITNGTPNTAGGCTPVGGSVPDCDCSACDALNPCTDGTNCKTTQCNANGYCVSMGLAVPLDATSGTYTAAASGQVLLGWDDQNTGATIASDGTYNLPAANFPDPVEPNGLRVIAAVLQVALQCTAAVDSDGPFGVGVPDLSSPTPDSLLHTYNIQVP